MGYTSHSSRDSSTDTLAIKYPNKIHPTYSRYINFHYIWAETMPCDLGRAEFHRIESSEFTV